MMLVFILCIYWLIHVTCVVIDACSGFLLQHFPLFGGVCTLRRRQRTIDNHLFYDYFGPNVVDDVVQWKYFWPAAVTSSGYHKFASQKMDTPGSYLVAVWAELFASSSSIFVHIEHDFGLFIQTLARRQISVLYKILNYWFSNLVM